MKKIISFALALAMLVVTTKAEAADFATSGYFMMTGNIFNNEALADSDTKTTFKVKERAELALDIVVSDEVSGQFKVRVPSSQQWNGATPDVNTQIRSAYIDFGYDMLQVRAGYQGHALTGYLGSGVNPVLDDNVPGVVAYLNLGAIVPELAWFVTDYTDTEKQNIYALSIPFAINDMMNVTPWAAMLDNSNKGIPTDTYVGATFDAVIDFIFAGAGILYAVQDSDDSIYSLLFEANATVDLGALSPGIALWYGMKGDDGGVTMTDYGSWGAFNGSNDSAYGNNLGLQSYNATSYDPFSSFGIVANVNNVNIGEYCSLGAHIMYIMDSSDESKDPNMELGAYISSDIIDGLAMFLEVNYFMPMTDNYGNGLNAALTLKMAF